MTTLTMTTLPTTTTTTHMQAVKGTQSPRNSPLREVTKTVIFQENVKVLTPRRSPRKRKSIPQEINNDNDDDDVVFPSPVRNPIAENISKPLLLTSITTTTSPRKRQIVEDTSSSLISQMAELMTLETPPNGLLKTPEADDTGDFVLEYQHPSILENTIQKVRIVYQKPLPPPLPPGKSILKKTSGKFTTSKSLAMATTTAKPSRNSNSNTNNNEHEEEAFTVQELNYRMSILFPEQHETLMQMPCDLARLVASFTLHQDEELQPLQQQLQPQLQLLQLQPQWTPQKKSVTRRRKVSLDGKTPGIHAIQPILPLMKELVHLELVHYPSSLNTNTSTSTTTPQQSKKVHFPAFNGSALQPPSDVIEGSDQLREDCIQQLTTVVQESHKLHTAANKANANKDRAKDTSILHHLVQYLKTDFVTYHHAQACANSFPSKSYPKARVAKAANAYVQDLTRILQPSSSTSKPCSWEFRLADLAAQHIRYWLRTLLNPIPDRAPSGGPPGNKNWRYRVCDIVALRVQVEGEESTAVEDGSLSSLVSDALSFLYEFFGTHKLKDLEDFEASPSPGSSRLPKEFCTSPLSLKQLFIAPEQWLVLEEEMTTATRFIAAMNAVQFLNDLFAIIVSEPKYQKLWKQWVQESAARLSLVDNSSLHSEDLHLVLLHVPLDQILQVLESISQRHAITYQQCQQRLDDMSQRFLFGKKSKRKKRHQPYLERLEGSYLETMEKIQFPRPIRIK